MASRFDVMYSKESNGQTFWTKCGVAFPFKNGKEGFQVMLDAVPAPVDGAYRLTFFPPKDNNPKAETYTPRGRPASAASRQTVDEMDDDIPF